jgi:hypothetical protein
MNNIFEIIAAATVEKDPSRTTLGNPHLMWEITRHPTDPDVLIYHRIRGEVTYTMWVDRARIEGHTSVWVTKWIEGTPEELVCFTVNRTRSIEDLATHDRIMGWLVRECPDSSDLEDLCAKLQSLKAA